ncbi:transposase [Sporosarcina obsidiansis]|uniref:transposase n=1 Tax=Sporosarcina obsidiansis TaxID=2660748 RepID=UPI0038B52733
MKRIKRSTRNDKNEIESAFSHIKGNRVFRRYLLWGLDKVLVEFVIVALAHNLLKVAGIRSLLLLKKPKQRKTSEENQLVFLTCFILGTYWTGPTFLKCVC